VVRPGVGAVGVPVRVGSLCTGYGGLDLAIGGELVFVSEIDPHANRLLEARFPGVPNLGDLTVLDSLPDCDILTAGFPCQPVSHAGRRAGTDDERCLWDDIESAISGMGRPPGVVFLENVRGLLTANGGDAMGRVVSGLARLGFVGSYRIVSAADVGACHRRERVFLRAHHANAPGVGWERGRPARDGGTGPENRGGHVADADESGGPAWDDQGHDRQRPRLQPVGSADPAQRFGPYQSAVTRWERIIGRPAPDPTIADTGRGRWDRGTERQQPEMGSEHGLQAERGESQRVPAGSRRLNPRFVEWMMGLPDGWVTGTDLGLPATAQLRILGNGVVPQQAAHAWNLLT